MKTNRPRYLPHWRFQFWRRRWHSTSEFHSSADSCGWWTVPGCLADPHQWSWITHTHALQMLRELPVCLFSSQLSIHHYIYIEGSWMDCHRAGYSSPCCWKGSLKERRQEEGPEGHELLTCCKGHRKTSIMNLRLTEGTETWEKETCQPS